jgi:segregation and condensation protein B
MNQLQAILFVASEPVSLERLATATQHPPADVRSALDQLAKSLDSSGLRLSTLGKKYRLVTAPEVAAVIRAFLQEASRTELSRAALETLAIIAYRGPITKLQIETIRGVSSDTMIRNLLARGLITESGRSQEPGRPVQYGITHAFLQHFGLTSPDDLPDITEASAASQPSESEA